MQSVFQFLRSGVFHITPNERASFRNHREYQRYLEGSLDPARVAHSHLRDSILIPAPHSWLMPANKIVDLGASQIRSLLQFDQMPPYLVMIFPIEQMRATGVKVRAPRGVDAIHGKCTQWAPGDVPDERIDQDIPLLALERLEWRP